MMEKKAMQSVFRAYTVSLPSLFHRFLFSAEDGGGYRSRMLAALAAYRVAEAGLRGSVCERDSAFAARSVRLAAPSTALSVARDAVGAATAQQAQHAKQGRQHMGCGGRKKKMDECALQQN